MKMRFDKQDQRFYNGYKQEPSVFREKIKIQISPFHWYLFIFIACSPLIFFVFKFGEHVLATRTSGYVVLPHIEVRAIEDGYLEKISVKLGQHVKINQLLGQIEQPELKKKASLLKSELDYLRNNPAKKDLKSAAFVNQANLNIAMQHKNAMKKRLDNLMLLFNQGAATDAEIKFTRFQYEEALARLADLESSASRAKDSTFIMQSTVENQEELRIKELILEKKKLDLHTRALSIYSPIAGTINEIFATEGGYVSRGDLVFSIAKNEKMHINTYLDHENIQYAKVGQTAKIAFADGERVLARVIKTTETASAALLNKPTIPTSKDREIMIQLELVAPVKQKLISGLPVEVFF